MHAVSVAAAIGISNLRGYDESLYRWRNRLTFTNRQGH
jgi:hypothetical protein